MRDIAPCILLYKLYKVKSIRALCHLLYFEVIGRQFCVINLQYQPGIICGGI